MNYKDRKYFVRFTGNAYKYDPIFVFVKEDVNRPNNSDCEQVLEDWIIKNYCNLENCKYWEISTVDYVEMFLSDFEEYEI